MNKSILFLAALLAALLPLKTKAADTGTLVVQGQVSLVNNIAVIPNGSNNTSLNILSGESGRLVASVQEISNSLTGYKINAKSQNGGSLVNASNPTKKTTYAVAYGGGSSVALTTSYQQMKNVSSLTGLTVGNSNVLVDVAAYASAPAGTYSDTITFQIVANP